MLISERLNIIISWICIILFISIVFNNINAQNTDNIINEPPTNKIELHLNAFNSSRDSLASEVNNYIKSVAPSSQIDPYVLVDLCSMYSVDLIFVIAQGQLESHFATKGTARRTNSIFNVGAYDGHSANKQKRNGFGYDDPNDSIEPFLMLLTNDYLVNGKTTNDLLNNYVNYLDKRYASNKKYEAQMKSIYRRISSNTSLVIAYENFLVNSFNLNGIYEEKLTLTEV